SAAPAPAAADPGHGSTPPGSVRRKRGRLVARTRPTASDSSWPVRSAEDFIEVAPAPAFARFDRLDDPVAGAAMLAAAGPWPGGVAAADMPAGNAGPQVNPPAVVGLVIFAAVWGAWVDLRRRLAQVAALLRPDHGRPGSGQPPEQAQRAVLHAFLRLGHAFSLPAPARGHLSVLGSVCTPRPAARGKRHRKRGTQDSGSARRIWVSGALRSQ